MEERNMQWLRRKNCTPFKGVSPVATHSALRKRWGPLLLIFGNLGAGAYDGTVSGACLFRDVTDQYLWLWWLLFLTRLVCNLILPFHSQGVPALWLLWSIEFGGNEDFLPSLSVLEPWNHHVNDEHCWVFQIRLSTITWPQRCESTQWRATIAFLTLGQFHSHNRAQLK